MDESVPTRNRNLPCLSLNQKLSEFGGARKNVSETPNNEKLLDICEKLLL